MMKIKKNEEFKKFKNLELKRNIMEDELIFEIMQKRLNQKEIVIQKIIDIGDAGIMSYTIRV